MKTDSVETVTAKPSSTPQPQFDGNKSKQEIGINNVIDKNVNEPEESPTENLTCDNVNNDLNEGFINESSEVQHLLENDSVVRETVDIDTINVDTIETDDGSNGHDQQIQFDKVSILEVKHSSCETEKDNSYVDVEVEESSVHTEENMTNNVACINNENSKNIEEYLTDLDDAEKCIDNVQNATIVASIDNENDVRIHTSEIIDVQDKETNIQDSTINVRISKDNAINQENVQVFIEIDETENVVGDDEIKQESCIPTTCDENDVKDLMNTNEEEKELRETDKSPQQNDESSNRLVHKEDTVYSITICAMVLDKGEPIAHPSIC